MKIKPKHLSTTAEPKRRLYRVLASSPRGITAIDTATFSTIRSNNLSSIEIPTHKDFSVLYPKQFFAEISSLSKDLYKRYQSTKTSLTDKLTKAAIDPSHVEDVDQPGPSQPETDPQTQPQDPDDMNVSDPLPPTRLRPKLVLKYPV